MSGECDKCGEQALECRCAPVCISIHDADFSVRTTNMLLNNGIKSLNELTEYTTRTILQWRWVGKKALDEIREKLAFHGMSLKDESVDFDVKKSILQDLPGLLKKIKSQVDEMQNELRFFSYKIEQVAREAEKTKKKSCRETTQMNS